MERLQENQNKQPARTGQEPAWLPQKPKPSRWKERTPRGITGRRPGARCFHDYSIITSEWINIRPVSSVQFSAPPRGLTRVHPEETYPQLEMRTTAKTPYLFTLKWITETWPSVSNPISVRWIKSSRDMIPSFSGLHIIWYFGCHFVY